MKKIAIAAAALTVGVLTAGAVESANTFVTIKATSSTTNTVIAVPLVNIGTGNAALNVTNFVLTTGLKDGATLTVKYGENWYAFRNNNGKWEGVYTVNNTDVNVPSGAETIARGGAAMLHNEFDGASFNFYLYGQLATDGATFQPAANATTLVANGSLAEITLSALTGLMNSPQPYDNILIPDANDPSKLKSYTYIDSTWKSLSADYDWVDGSSAAIPVGTGFWYVSKTSTPPTITWGSQE